MSVRYRLLQRQIVGARVGKMPNNGKADDFFWAQLNLSSARATNRYQYRRALGFLLSPDMRRIVFMPPMRPPRIGGFFVQ